MPNASTVPCVAVLLLALSAASAFAGYECRLTDAEEYVAQSGAGLRNAGITSWMGHPSGGKVMVLGAEGHCLECQAEGLVGADQSSHR